MHEDRPISDFISAHHAAVLVDEASFDADGLLILDVTVAEKIAADERSAFIEFVSAPCRSPEEVQAKLRYLLDGTVGERSSFLDYLFEYGADVEDGLLTPFLRSLLLADAPRGCTHEEEA